MTISNKRKLFVSLIAGLIGFILFLVIYGVKILNPFYVDWLYNGRDLMQHYLGWEFFRRGDWTFPFGMTNQLGYPSQTSVIFTDSIPVLAVIFKLFSFAMPEHFQYFGFWGILCFGLQGYFAARVLQVYIKKDWQVLSGSVLFILAPPLLFRMYMHTALASQWIVLAAIYLCAVHSENYNYIRKTSLQWGILGFLIAGIHMYFAPMCAVLLAGYVIYSCFSNHKFAIKYFVPGVSFLVGLVGNTYLLGGLSSSADVSSTNLGVHSFNLNSFWNPMGYSKILNPQNTYTNGQYEGFSYLGIGIMLMLIVALMYYVTRLIRRKIVVDFWKTIITLCVMLGLTLLAASPSISFGTHLIIELPDIDLIMKIWGLFGSSGRLIWPVYYCIMFVAVIGTCRLIDSLSKFYILGYLLLAGCVAVQIFDLSGKIEEIHTKYQQDPVYEEFFTDEIWDKIAQKGYEYIVWVSHNTDGYTILHMAKFAYDNHMTMNNYYFARGIDFRENVKDAMSHINKQSIYIFKPGDPFDYEMYENYEDKLCLYEANGYIVGSVEPLE